MPLSSLWSGPIKLLKRNLLSSLILLSVFIFRPSQKWLSHELDVRVSLREARYHMTSLMADRKELSHQKRLLQEKLGEGPFAKVCERTLVGLTPAPNALWHDLHWCRMLYGFLQRFWPLQIGLFCFCLVFCLVILNSRKKITFQVRVVVGDTRLCYCVALLNIYIWCQTCFVHGVSRNIHQNISQCLAGWQTDNWLHIAKTLTLILETTCE